MQENFSAGQFLRKADKCSGICKVNWSMGSTISFNVAASAYNYRAYRILLYISLLVYREKLSEPR
jgi:hypothetical protein